MKKSEWNILNSNKFYFFKISLAK